MSALSVSLSLCLCAACVLQAPDIHRAFQRDLCKMRLETARAYVKTLSTDGSTSMVSWSWSRDAQCSVYVYLPLHPSVASPLSSSIVFLGFMMTDFLNVSISDRYESNNNYIILILNRVFVAVLGLIMMITKNNAHTYVISLSLSLHIHFTSWPLPHLSFCLCYTSLPSIS